LLIHPPVRAVGGVIDVTWIDVSGSFRRCTIKRTHNDEGGISCICRWIFLRRILNRSATLTALAGATPDIVDGRAQEEWRWATETTASSAEQVRPVDEYSLHRTPTTPTHPSSMLLRSMFPIGPTRTADPRTPSPYSICIRHHPFLVLSLRSPQLVRPPRHAKALRPSHLTAPDLALHSRIAGKSTVTCFVRNECRTNAVLCPLSIGVFALSLRANE
jgi:hypothetical protein